MVTEKATILSEKGLHLRPASFIVDKMTHFDSKVTLQYEGREINVKSVINFVAARLQFGDEVTVFAQGPDEVEALEKLVMLLESNLEEEHLKE